MKKSLIICLSLIISSPAAGDFATGVVSSSALGAAPYDYAGAAVGEPTRSFYDWAAPSVIFKSSLVAGPFHGLRTDTPDSVKTVVTIRTGGHLTVKFDRPIEDDPLNWYGKDFIVFGNSAFNGGGLIPGNYVEPDTDMEQYWIDDYASGRWEPSVVSVAQYPDGPWYTYTNGPFADDFAPTQACAWDYINRTWGPEMDFTRPVPPALTKASFEARLVDDIYTPLTAAEGIDLYKGSGGGTAFDLAVLDLPVNANGRKWIQYIKVAGRGGEIDAFSRVSHALKPITIGEAKKLPDGARVILTEQIVSSGTDAFADCCYIQSPDRSSGIKLAGRRIETGKRVLVEGVMATTAGEREIRATSIQILESK